MTEQSRHFLRRIEMPLTIRFEQSASRFHIGALADTGDDIVQRALIQSCVERVVGSEQRDAGRGGSFGEAVDLPPVLSVIWHDHTKPQTIADDALEPQKSVSDSLVAPTFCRSQPDHMGCSLRLGRCRDRLGMTDGKRNDIFYFNLILAQAKESAVLFILDTTLFGH